MRSHFVTFGPGLALGPHRVWRPPIKLLPEALNAVRFAQSPAYGARVGRASNDRFLSRVDGRVGVGRSGADDNECEVNLLMARRSTATGAAVISALSSPSALHVPFLVCTPAGDLVRPTTVLVNQTALVTPTMSAHVRGPVQTGVAEAVDGAPLLRRLSGYLVGEIVLMMSLRLPLELGYIEPSFPVDERLRASARRAAGHALDYALDGLPFIAVLPGFDPAKPAVAAAPAR